MGEITLVAILCHSLAGIPQPVCVDEIVPTEQMIAGKCSDAPCSDAIPMGMSVYACMSGDGLRQAQEWAAGQLQYHEWRIAGVKCVQGPYAPSKRA